MSSFIEFQPEISTTKVTRYVRIDNDFQLTVGVDTSGTVAYSYYNLTGIPDEFTYEPSPPDDNLVFSRLSKEGANESLVNRIKMFYNATDDSLEDYQIPQSWIYNATINKDNYLPSELPSSVSQTFPVIIWNTLEDGAAQPSTNSASVLTFGSLYTRLGTVAERRSRLKLLILEMINHPNYLQWLAGGTVSTRNDEDATELLEEIQRLQTLSYFPEMLARAVSIDSNLNTQAKFNLLLGMSQLNLGQVMARAPRLLSVSLSTQSGQSNPTDNRNNWSFQRIGDVAGSSPFAYTAPSGNTWSAAAESTITMSGSSAIGDDWQAWLRL